jgi:hypothetical protein
MLNAFSGISTLITVLVNMKFGSCNTIFDQELADCMGCNADYLRAATSFVSFELCEGPDTVGTCRSCHKYFVTLEDYLSTVLDIRHSVESDICKLCDECETSENIAAGYNTICDTCSNQCWFQADCSSCAK